MFTAVEKCWQSANLLNQCRKKRLNLQPELEQFEFDSRVFRTYAFVTFNFGKC